MRVRLALEERVVRAEKGVRPDDREEGVHGHDGAYRHVLLHAHDSSTSGALVTTLLHEDRNIVQSTPVEVTMTSEHRPVVSPVGRSTLDAAPFTERRAVHMAVRTS